MNLGINRTNFNNSRPQSTNYQQSKGLSQQSFGMLDLKPGDFSARISNTHVIDCLTGAVSRLKELGRKFDVGAYPIYGHSLDQEGVQITVSMQGPPPPPPPVPKRTLLQKILGRGTSHTPWVQIPEKEVLSKSFYGSNLESADEIAAAAVKLAEQLEKKPDSISALEKAME
jgi:hypothetical protein